LLALATGIFYFTFAVTGLSLSAGFAILIIGIPFFLLFIGTARVLALAEGWIVESLLGTRMPRRPVHPGPPMGWMQRVLEMLKDPRTWGTLLYLLLMLPLGVFYFTFVIVGIVCSLALTIAPIVVLLFHAGLITIDGTVESPHPALLPLVSILGIVLLTVTLHLARGIGYLHGQLAKSLLVRAPRTADEPAVALQAWMLARDLGASVEHDAEEVLGRAADRDQRIGVKQIRVRLDFRVGCEIFLLRHEGIRV